MRAGALNLSVDIQSLTATQDATGQPVESWSTFATVYANRRDVRGRERFEADQTIAVRSATYRIRWLAGLNETMRIVDAGTTYRIVGIADDYARGWMEISAEAFNPADTQ